jgi:ribosome-binding protein aMBF1 (putative translation factor)
MEHQDFKTITFNSKEKKVLDQNKKEVQKRISQKQVSSNDNEVVKVQADKKLGQLLSQARLAKGFKTQVDFIKELNQKTNLNISVQIYGKWESNKEVPTNEQIAKMEKVLTAKLPRNKKIKIDN